MHTAYILRAHLFDGTLVTEKRFGGLPIRIGRNPLNDFKIPQARVSSFHAVLEPSNHVLCVRDLGSMNGVHVRQGQAQTVRIQPNTLVDLAQHGNEFFVGPQVQVSVQTVALDEPLSLREGSASDGAVLGNAQMLMAPGYDPAAGDAPFPQQPPPVAPPKPTSAPPPPGFGVAGPPLPAHVPPWGPHGAPPSMPFNQPAGGGPGPPHGPTGSQASEVSAETGHFSHYALEALALQGLHELAGSLVPGNALQTSGDVARFVTKLHDAIDVFCRCFIPLREGYSQFVSSLDLQRAANMRSFNRSPAYLAVEAARDPETLARGLLDWTDRSLDGSKAIEGIYADLMIHQVALLDGFMQGVRALLDELSPANVEQEASSGRFALSNRYKDLWQTYCDRFDELSEEKQAFSRIFGHEFSEAYRQYQRRRRSGETT